MRCYCQGQCPDGSRNGTCLAAPGAGCFAAAEEVYDPDTDSLVAERTYGCLPPEERGLMMCRGNLSPHANPLAIQCCKQDMCNKQLYPMYQKEDYPDYEAPSGGVAINPAIFHLVLLCTVTVCIVSLVFFVTCLYLKYKRREIDRQRYLYRAAKTAEPGPAGSLKELLEQSSGTGAGLPLLVQRTIAKQVEMQERVGQGRYGEVWLARWRGERVAVKVFYTTEEASWFRETEIYQTVLMRHSNILGFIAADIKGTGGWTQMLLVTDYHERGSLHDYLNHHTLDLEQSAVLSHSIACGLAHLHIEIFGSKGKPAIAHRDIKSRNILVKADGTGAIADFGLAARFTGETGQLDVQPNNRVGTRRYMAPEVLVESLEPGAAAEQNRPSDAILFEGFKMADIYSFSLVLWEINRRTRTSEKKELVAEYQPPYYDVVPPDPSLSQMLNTVVVNNVRPAIPEAWSQNDQLAYSARVMVEGWGQMPSSRPTALRIKKNMARLLPNPVPAHPHEIV